MSSLRERILAAEDRPFEDVPTPEWEKAGVAAVRIGTMSVADRDVWEGDISDAKKLGARVMLHGFSAGLVARCAMDPDTGERLFKDEDVAALQKKSAKAMQRLFDVACRLNGIGLAEAKAIEKNLGGGPAGAS